MPRRIPAPCDPAEMERFAASFLYDDAALLVDEVLRMDTAERAMEARLDTRRPLPFAALQRTSGHHPAHLAGGDLIMATGSLGCLHAFFFHGCHWDRGWVAFGSRIHRADFKRLARLGPPLLMHSRETRSRCGPERVVLRFEFRFFQQDALVYSGEQTAFFLREPVLDGAASTSPDASP